MKTKCKFGMRTKGKDDSLVDAVGARTVMVGTNAGVMGLAS